MGAEHSGIVPIRAYILVKADDALADDVAERLREQVPHAQVHRVDGIYDIVVSLTADTPEYITATVREQLRPVQGVVAVDALVWTNDELMRPVPGFESRAPDA